MGLLETSGGAPPPGPALLPTPLRGALVLWDELQRLHRLLMIGELLMGIVHPGWSRGCLSFPGIPCLSTRDSSASFWAVVSRTAPGEQLQSLL